MPIYQSTRLNNAECLDVSHHSYDNLQVHEVINQLLKRKRVAGVHKAEEYKKKLVC